MSSQPTMGAPGLHFSGAMAEALDECLHAMGQPLTVLQSCVLFQRRPPTDVAEANAFVGEMIEEVARVTALYGCLRDLVNLGLSTAPEPPASVQDLLTTFEPTWKMQAQQGDVDMEFSLAPLWLQVTGNGELLRLALTMLFEALLASAKRGERVLIDGAGSAGELVFERVPQPERGLSSDKLAKESWRVRVATALVQAEGGSVLYRNHPFRVAVHLASSAEPCIDSVRAEQ